MDAAGCPRAVGELLGFDALRTRMPTALLMLMLRILLLLVLKDVGDERSA